MSSYYSDDTRLDAEDLLTLERELGGQLSWDQLEVLAGYSTGTVQERRRQLWAWTSDDPGDRRPVAQRAISRALAADHNPFYNPSSRVVEGGVLPRHPARVRTDGIDEVVGTRFPTIGTPVLVSHDEHQPIGTLIAAEQLNDRELRVWLELDSSPLADEWLTATDYGQVGLSPNLLYARRTPDDNAVRTIDRAKITEISVCPLEHAALGPGTQARRRPVPSHILDPQVRSPEPAPEYDDDDVAFQFRTASGAIAQTRSWGGFHIKTPAS